MLSPSLLCVNKASSIKIIFISLVECHLNEDIAWRLEINLAVGEFLYRSNGD